MRTIDRRSKFRRDLKRESTGLYRRFLLPDGELWDVIAAIANDIPLPQSYQDHPLHGDLEGSRECHIKPDFLLVYTLVGDDWLILERLGSHSEIFGR